MEATARIGSRREFKSFIWASGMELFVRCNAGWPKIGRNRLPSIGRRLNPLRLGNFGELVSCPANRIGGRFPIDAPIGDGYAAFQIGQGPWE